MWSLACGVFTLWNLRSRSCGPLSASPSIDRPQQKKQSAFWCRKEHKEDFDYAVVATGLFNVPVHPKWAEGLVRSQPPPEGSGPWVVDVKDFTDENLAAVSARPLLLSKAC